MIDPTVAEVLLLPELKGEGARFFGAVVSLLFEVVARGGSLPIEEGSTSARIARDTFPEFQAKVAKSGLFVFEDGAIRSRVADSILERSTIGAMLFSKLGSPTIAKTEPRRKADRNATAPDSYSKDFEEFWCEYRGIGGTQIMNKLQAYTAYEKALKRGATEEEILSGLRKYAAYQRALIDANASKKSFVKMPSTWLNGSSWADILPSVEDLKPTASKPKKSGDPEKAPEPVKGVDFFETYGSVTDEEGRTYSTIKRSIYADGYVRFYHPGWLIDQGYPLAAELWVKKAIAAAQRGASPFEEPDRTAAPVEDRDFFVSDKDGLEYWPNTAILFDRRLWKLGHGD